MQSDWQLVAREWWLSRIEDAWARRPVVWLHGVRRSGKTSLCRTIPDVEYFDCELPRSRRMMEDPEAFLARMQGRKVALDEIHRLDNPAELLKIAADHYPSVRIVATGSSTLSASARFKDTLAGRKLEVKLLPLLLEELSSFGSADLERRMLRGGLPEFFMAGSPDPAAFAEWLDAFWARDILALFRLEKRSSFQRLVELVMAGSGGIFEAARHARSCAASHTTVANYMSVLEATGLVHVVRPFSRNPSVELVAAPRVYGFDTGFVCHCRGWSSLRSEECGPLWEHLVLAQLLAHRPGKQIHYWRDKRGHEVDFVFPGPGGSVDVVECKWKVRDLEAAGLAAFRRRYPAGRNFVAGSDVPVPFDRRSAGLPVRYVSPGDLVAELDLGP